MQATAQVRLHPVKVKTVGVPTTKIMDLFGIELDDLLRVRAGRGVAVRDNDLFLAPSQMLAVARGSRQGLVGLRPRRPPRPRARDHRRAASAKAAVGRAAQLHLVPRRPDPLRPVDDDRRGSPAHRRRPARHVRLLFGASTTNSSLRVIRETRHRARCGPTCPTTKISAPASFARHRSRALRLANGAHDARMRYDSADVHAVL